MVILYFVFEAILTFVFQAIYGTNVLNSIADGGYETLNNSDVSVYYSYLSMVMFAPAIYIASKIVRDRPFSSYSSSRGGWNWKLYFKCLSIPFAIYLVFSVISLFTSNNSGSNSQVSLMAIILSLIIIPAHVLLKNMYSEVF